MRLFFGVPVSDEIRRKTHELQGHLKVAGEKVKWVEPANLHFTLRFLGEVPEAWVDSVAQAADGVWEAVEADRVVLHGVGAFPSPKRPRVVWIGVREGAETVQRLYEVLSDKLEAQLGIAREGREFTPHLTIGRVKARSGGEALVQMIEELSEAEVDEFVIERFDLYQSVLRRTGPVYRSIKAYRALTHNQGA